MNLGRNPLAGLFTAYASVACGFGASLVVGNGDAMLAGMITEGVHKRGLPLTTLSRITAGNTARIMGLAPRKGTLLPGADADIAVVDLNEEWVFDGTQSLSKTKTANNLYHGSKMKGRVKQTWVRGQLVYEDGVILVPAGYGRYVPKNRAKS